MNIPDIILFQFPSNKYLVEQHWHKLYGPVYYVRKYGGRITPDLGVWYDIHGKVLYREPLFFHRKVDILEWHINIIQ